MDQAYDSQRDKTSFNEKIQKTADDSDCNPEESTPQEDVGGFECPVCLQTASFPVQLPCRHIFCFLCVKGVANRSKRCAMCRQEIPADFFNDPKLLHKHEVCEKSKTIFDEGYQWFYEGRNGWWQYDERTSQELENKYKDGEKIFELLIAGFLYMIDLENMRQFRRNDQTRRRKIKRDMCTITGVKGIAGIKYQDSRQVRPSGDGGEACNNTNSNGNPSPVIPTSSVTSSNQSSHLSSAVSHINSGPDGGHDDSYLGPPAPNNTPQAPMTPADSQPGSLSNSQEDLSLHLHNLQLNGHPQSVGRSRPDSPNYTSPTFLNDEQDLGDDNDISSGEESEDDERVEQDKEFMPFTNNVRETCL